MYHFIVNFQPIEEQKSGKAHVVEADRMFLHERAAHFVDEDGEVIAVYDFNQCVSVIRCNASDVFKNIKIKQGNLQ